MARLPIRTIEDAPEASQPLLTAAQKANGFLPNLLGILANAPAALEAYPTLSGINGRAPLTLAQREVMQLMGASWRPGAPRSCADPEVIDAYLGGRR